MGWEYFSGQPLGADIYDWFHPNQYNEESSGELAADAPGCPGKDDGFKPKIKWDGKKVKKPNGKGKGYPAKDGGVWVSTGPGGALPGTTGGAHGGPHWDVQYPNGRYVNVYPGGKKR